MFSIPNGQSLSSDGRPPVLRAKGGAQLGTQAEPGTTTNFTIRKVLIVDDEVDLADLAAMLLSARGLQVLTANSARQALDLLAGDPDIDAIISDVVMPGLTGLQLADAVTEMYPRVKVVLVSGYTLPSQLADRERHYLFATKPYKAETLLKLLQS